MTREQLNKLVNELKEMENKIKESIEKNEELSQDNEDLMKKIEVYRQKYKHFKKSVTNLENFSETLHKTNEEGQKTIEEQKQQIEEISRSFKDIIRSMTTYEDIEKQVKLISKNNEKIHDDYKELRDRYYNDLSQELEKQKNKIEFLKHISDKMGLKKNVRSVKDNLKNISSRLAINKLKKLGDEYNFKKIKEEFEKWYYDDKGDEPDEEEEKNT